MPVLDLIQYALNVMPATDATKGPGKRLELAFKNLTDAEASALLIVLDRLQAARQRQWPDGSPRPTPGSSPTEH